jgi:hypothetical protein
MMQKVEAAYKDAALIATKLRFYTKQQKEMDKAVAAAILNAVRFE